MGDEARDDRDPVPGLAGTTVSGGDGGVGGVAAAATAATTTIDLTGEPVEAVVEVPTDDAFWRRLAPLIRIDRRDRWIELVGVLLAALAMVGASWAVYQATRWNGEEADLTREGAARRADAADLSALATTQTDFDVGLWLTWLDAVARDDLTGVELAESQMRDEFRPALDAWLASADIVGGELPEGTPFELPEYQLEASGEAQRLGQEAATALDEAADANANELDFLLAAVIFIGTLFFAGLGTRLKSVGVRAAALLAAAIVVVGSALWMFSLPGGPSS